MLNRHGYIINKELLGHDTWMRLRKELTVTPEKTFSPSPYAQATGTFHVFHDTGTHVCLPRYFSQLQEDLPKGIDRFRQVETTQNLVFEGRLKEETCQPMAVEKCMEAFREHKGGVLSLPTGYGKTTVALNIACRMGLKTMVVTHKEFLMDQWIERIRQFVPRARVGKLQQDTCEVEGRDIVVAMLQSICLKQYHTSTFEGFGLLIIDEVHHISAPVFSRSLFRVCCPYMLGLSATPHRKDGLTKVIEWFLGPIFFTVTRREQRHVSIQTISYRSEAYRRPLPTMRTGTINMAQVITNLCEDRTRNDIVVQTAMSLVTQGRKLMILSERRLHCEYLVARLQPLLGTIGKTIGLYIGGMNQAALKHAEASDAIVATYSQANEGLDIPSLDTLLLATPKSDVVQSVGRILREASHVSKRSEQQPLVVDVVDAHAIFYAQFTKRKAYYKTSGFTMSRDQEPESTTTEFMFRED